MCRSLTLIFLGVSFSFLPTMAQQNTVNAEGFGTVTGHIICADTGRPARFAQAILFAIPKDVTKSVDPAMRAKNSETDLVKALGFSTEVNMVSSETGFDGGFTANNVAPGDYYVFASVPGYIQPTSLITSIIRKLADYSNPLPGVLVVHVTADRIVNAEVSVPRGASVSGTIAWDDGSPVTGARVQVLSVSGASTQAEDTIPAAKKNTGFLTQRSASVDAQGNYIISFVNLKSCATTGILVPLPFR